MTTERNSQPKSPPEYVIYTDGACSGNPGPGGWAALVQRAENENLLVGAEKLTTNNRMEMMAVIKATQSLLDNATAVVYSDSKYVIDGITKWLPRWKVSNWVTASGKLAKNSDLWRLLDEENQRLNVRWEWVKGHAGHPQNERVDLAARIAIEDLIKSEAAGS